MAIEWEETVETKRMVRLTVTHGPSCHDATVDDLRSACEAAGLVVETMERAEADREDRTALRESLQKMHDERIVCLDALSESVTPGGTTLSPRPPSVLAGIRSLQGRLRDARSDLREHDAALEAAVERRSEEADASTEQARAILNAVPGEDIVSAARRTMASLGLTAARARAEKAESRISKAEALREHVRTLEADLAAARARIAELEAPMPEATVEELERVGEAAYTEAWNRSCLDSRRAVIRAVAERVRRVRPQCLIARAVAANIDVRVAEDLGGGFLVAAHRAGEDEHVEHTVPAAEVPAELARMLTEVGA